jgi:hypothetical protein
MSRRLLEAALWFFAAWTATTNVIGLFSLQSWLLYPSLLVATLAAAAAFRRSSSAPDAFPEIVALHAPGPAPSVVIPVGRNAPWLGIAALSALLAAMAIQYKWTRLEPFWALAVMAVVAGLVLQRATPGPEIRCRPGAVDGPWPVLGVFVAFVALYLVINTPDADDSLYVAFAISARDSEFVYAADSFFGIEDFPFAKSTYRLESYILLTSAFSGLSGIPALATAHLVTPLLGLFLSAGALVVVFKSIAGVRWWAALAAYVVLLLAFAAPYSSFGAHAIPRAFHGKGVLVFAVIPLIVYLTAAALLSGRPRAFTMLALAQITALGLTANAIFIAPLASALVGLTFFLHGGGKIRLRAVALAATVAYPAAAGAYLLAFDPPSMSQIDDVGRVGNLFWQVGGSPTGHIVLLGAIAAGAGAALLRPELKLVSLYVFCILITILNPVLWPFWGEYVTGNVNQRLFYAAPVLFFLALTFAAAQARTALPVKLVAAVALGAGLLAPSSMLWRAGPPDGVLRVPAGTFAAAQTLNGLGDSLLLAPEPVSAWIPTLEDARPVVVARRIDFLQRRAQFSPEAFEARLRLADWISGRTPTYAGVGADLDRICVGAVAVPVGAAAEVAQAVEAVRGFSRGEIDDWIVYTRDAAC